MYKYDSREQMIANRMMDMGFHMSNKGFKYILKAVTTIQDMGETDELGVHRIKMTGDNGLYGNIAKCYDATPARVERCIRAEIERFYTYNSDIPNVLACDEHSGKLTNSEFLARLTNMFCAEGLCE